MQILAVANHKGGVGKSATAQTLGAILAESRRVLLVDLDPQASLTQAVGVDDAGGASMAEVLGDATPGGLALADIIHHLGPGLDLAPGDISLSRSELGLVARMGREDVLRRALCPIGQNYDLAIIDTPPSLSLLTINALAAADGVLIPTQPQIADMRGLRLFLDSVDQVRRELNPGLEVVGVVVTFYDRRLNHHGAAIEAMERAGLPLMMARIGRTIRVAEAAGVGQAVTDYAPSNPQSDAYRDLATEVVAWLDKRRPT